MTLLLAGGLLLPVAIAKATRNTASLSKDALQWTEKNGQITLTVVQTSLQSVLQHIARQHRFPIHFSSLPEQLINTTCTGANLPQVLACLLQNKADVIVRYQPDGAKHKIKPLIAEAWIVQSTANQTDVNPGHPVLTTTNDNAQSQASKANETAKKHGFDKLLAQAQSHDSQQKAVALGALLAAGRKDDPILRDVLEQALTDQNPEVRAQALSTLAHREGNDVLAAIQQGLHDESEDVRLIAVEGIKDDIALLQQMINDKDEAVQSLAEIKLQILTQRPVIDSLAPMY